MEDEILVRFKSVNVRQTNEESVDQLKKRLNEWSSETRALIKRVVKERADEIDEYYGQYDRQMGQEYERINAEKGSNRSSSHINNQIKTFNQASTIEGRIQLVTKPCTREQFADQIQVTYNKIHIPSSEPHTPIKVSPDKERSSSSSKQTPVQSPISKHSSGTSTPTLLPDRKEDVLKIEPPNEPTPEKIVPGGYCPTPRIPQPATRLYVGRHDVFVPVLIGIDREVSNETEQITEYSIDSIPISHVKQHQREQSSNLNPEDDIRLVHTYKSLVNDEHNTHRALAGGSLSHDDEEEPSGTGFSLRQFDQINYSTILFRQYKTEYNCMASSTNRNELIVYNSKLKMLIILQNENNQQFRHRFFVQWPDSLTSEISDITYCETNDQYVISTQNISHLYMFNRDLLSLTDLGLLEPHKPLRRIHCYKRTLYCISDGAYLDEYKFDRQYSSIQIVPRDAQYGSTNSLRDPTAHLLDVTCDENHLAILYVHNQSTVHLELLDRQTRRVLRDIQLDGQNYINQSYIRLESRLHGHFVYLNGEQKHLKSIDFSKNPRGKVTSVMRRHAIPTNTCFLRDGRLVILYEDESNHFLSIHELNHSETK